ncbi:MAG: hypothetical protein WCJ23_07475 [Verrucomicrobiota bacterium]
MHPSASQRIEADPSRFCAAAKIRAAITVETQAAAKSSPCGSALIRHFVRPSHSKTGGTGPPASN